MPRAAKGARLYLRKARHDGTGKLTHHATWVIRDGGSEHPTRCLAAEIAGAETALRHYIAAKYEPKRKEQDIERIPIADVLSLYDDDCRSRQRNQRVFDKMIERLNDWWGALMLSAVNGETCRAYELHRGTPGGARRDLETLRASINHHAEQGLHRGVVKVVLPEKGLPRERWLTRDEAAHLIWTCWRAREMQRRHRGRDKGKTLPTDKRPLRHLARFILIGLYTGTRGGAVASASPIPAIGRSFVDLERGIYHRLAQGRRASNKRQPAAPIPARLLAHMRRWHRLGIIKRHFVEFNGEAVQSVKTGFAHAVELAKLPGQISPHTLRHTAATWLMQAGCDPWEASGFLGMSVKTLIDVYGHHHPDHLKGAAHAMGYGTRRGGRLR